MPSPSRRRRMMVFVGILALTWGLFQLVPKGFIPVQDKQYLVGLVQLPNAASLNRTDEVVRRVADIAHPATRVQFPGLSIAGFTNSPNAAIVFFGLDDFDKRESKDLYGLNIAKQLNILTVAVTARLVRSPQTVEVEVERPDEGERLKFILASYNTGAGHVEDAQHVQGCCRASPQRCACASPDSGTARCACCAAGRRA